MDPAAAAPLQAGSQAERDARLDAMRAALAGASLQPSHPPVSAASQAMSFQYWSSAW
jgi:hypothetical protein